MERKMQLALFSAIHGRLSRSFQRQNYSEEIQRVKQTLRSDILIVLR